ncbi:MAG: transposase domain-containing protein, partial [Burkholderiaceae bacterium]|nr:transposase domain-containing protein [Burkholderiaceae bacterium]
DKKDETTRLDAAVQSASRFKSDKLLATAKLNGIEPLAWLTDNPHQTADLPEQPDRLIAAAGPV